MNYPPIEPGSVADRIGTAIGGRLRFWTVQVVGQTFAGNGQLRRDGGCGHRATRDLRRRIADRVPSLAVHR